VNEQVEALGTRESRPPRGSHEPRQARVVDDVAHGGRAGNELLGEVVERAIWHRRHGGHHEVHVRQAPGVGEQPYLAVQLQDAEKRHNRTGPLR